MKDDLEQFLEDTQQEEQTDILNQPLDPESVEDTTGQQEDEYEEGEEDNYEDAEPSEPTAKTRRERRLMEKLEAERESASFLAGKLEAMTGAKGAADDPDYLKGIERIYGTDSPEAQMATELLTKAIVGARDDAENRAYDRWSNEQLNSERAVAEAESELDSVMDEIEDTYGVSLTEAQESDYFALMQKMSPKDRSTGEVIGLADPHSVWEVYKERTARSSNNSKSKQLASRSLTGSSSPERSDLPDDSQQRFLKENGII